MWLMTGCPNILISELHLSMEYLVKREPQIVQNLFTKFSLSSMNFLNWDSKDEGMHTHTCNFHVCGTACGDSADGIALKEKDQSINTSRLTRMHIHQTLKDCGQTFPSDEVLSADSSFNHQMTHHLFFLLSP